MIKRKTRWEWKKETSESSYLSYFTFQSLLPYIYLFAQGDYLKKDSYFRKKAK